MAAGVGQQALGLKLVVVVLNPGRQLANMDDRVGDGDGVGDDDMGALVGWLLCQRRSNGEHG